jgi:hypothetical protein
VCYDRDWHDLGTKTDHADWISDITGIDLEALFPGGSHEDLTEATLDRFCIDKRMSWAAKCETTRVEDIAYCLLGILTSICRFCTANESMLALDFKKSL